MSIHEKIKLDLTVAVKAGKEVVGDLRYILGEFSRLKGKKDGKEFVKDILSDVQAERVLTDIKNGEQKLLELVEDAKSTLIGLIDSYLPTKASEEEVITYIKANIDFSTLDNKMKAVGTVKKHFGTNADGKMISEIIKNWED